MKVYAPWDWVAHDWGIQDFGNDPTCSVAALPVMFNEPHMFCYKQDLQDLDLSRYELVILSDIEFESIETIQQWINKNKIKRYVLALGGRVASETLDPDCMLYRPWWCFNMLKHNTYRHINNTQRPYMFDALLGARRPHRDYVMLGLQHHELLSVSVATYRDIFHTGGVVNNQTEEFAKIFCNQTLLYPYVSPNLDPTWEVRDTIDKSISPYVPWQIYQHSWYSIVAETVGTGNRFFFSEKTTKCLYAGRPFVMFGSAEFLQGLRNLGFETFGSVIDESYDTNWLDFERFRQAFEQLRYLSCQDPIKVYDKLKPTLEHNRHRIWQLRHEVRQRQKLLLEHTSIVCHDPV